MTFRSIAIAIASATNTLSKVGIALVLGGVALGLRVGAVLGVGLLGGGLVLLLVG